ncbi:class A beta-lactamase [Streptomyces sp. ISL-22]|uniref:class A beta-lactamase n=1 Tax=unclassified Streptomyces TaxID=2593676 RepID=UPI001BEA2290|nr:MULTISPECIES: class A beta-lactamase [unclassified Streptomyces]MBT2420288.1 class A beta-lactamase [Streptomyces sp. ISL-24]MBT2433098.1 class A beta-lactamase [Streptomyces sp. ISL-22]
MTHSLRSRRGAAWAAAGLLALAVLPACGQQTAAGAGSPAGAARSAAPGAATKSATAEFRSLEREFDARLGVYALDTGTGRSVGYRADDRFAYASTFKALAAGAVLRKFGTEGMDRVVRYSRDDLVADSPVSENFVKTGMSLRGLCAATLWYSDNTAVNLLLDELGGPDGLEKVLEEFGDDVTEMDRYEPDMSEGAPGDIRDTSTPRAMAGSLRTFLLGDALKADERELLRQWMTTNMTGRTLIRAGVPDGWDVADKSGTAGYGGRNNIAVVWPDDGGNPIVMAVMSSRDKQGAERNDALLAKAATVAVKGLGR